MGDISQMSLEWVKHVDTQTENDFIANILRNWR